MRLGQPLLVRLLALALALPSIARAQAAEGSTGSGDGGPRAGAAEAAAAGQGSTPNEGDAAAGAREGEPASESAAAASAAEPAAEPEPETVAISSAEAQALRKQELAAEIARVVKEREDTHRLLPWLVTATGVAVLALGLSVGIGRTLSCEHSCSTPAWAGWTVVAGATLGMGGAIWIVRKNADISELDRRRDQLELQLKEVEWNMAALAPPARAALAWSARF